MLHRLCLAFGAPFVHPDVLAANLTIRQIDDWIRYWSIERFGPPADDYRAAMIAWGAIAGGRGTKLKPADLMPKWSTEPPTAADYMAKARAAYARATARL